MSNVLNLKKNIIMGVVVFLFSLMQIGSFASEDWQVVTQLPTKRSGIAAAVVDGKIYVIGGTLENVGGPEGISTVEEYDPQTNTWRQLADLPTRRYYPKADVVAFDTTGLPAVPRAVTSVGKLSTSWGELKAEHQNQP